MKTMLPIAEGIVEGTAYDLVYQYYASYVSMNYYSCILPRLTDSRPAAVLEVGKVSRSSILLH